MSDANQQPSAAGDNAEGTKGESAKGESANSWAYKRARKIVIAVVGVTVILAGVAMLVLPGPGIAAIIAGLAILATEFVWAARLLRRAKEHGEKGLRTLFPKWDKREPPTKPEE